MRLIDADAYAFPGDLSDEPTVSVAQNWQLYTEYRGDKPVAYRYGEPWVAMQLAMEGGYKTPEKAKLAWLEYLETESAELMYCDPLNENRIWVGQDVYERIKNNPKGVIIDAVGKQPILIGMI